MEHDLVLEGRVVSPGGLLEAEVGVSEGLVAEVGRGLRGSRRIRTERCLIFPGFVDMHVHLREPGWEHKEDFRTGTLAAVHGGVTTVVDMPNNPVPTVSAANLELKKRLARDKAEIDVRFYGGVLPEGIGRIREMASGVVGYKLYLSETTGTKAFPESELGRAFGEIASTEKPASLHCESQHVIDRRKKELQGVETTDLHADARPPEAEVESVGTVIAALKNTPELRANICHASTGETLRLVRRARTGGMRVYCEATLHHLYFNRRAMLENRLLKTNPPLRGEEDRQALVAGVLDGGASFLVTDHAPHLEAEKLMDGRAGVPGLDDYSHVVSWLLREHGADPLLIAKVTSSNPASYLSLADRGEIAVGRRADFAVLDTHSPEIVTNDNVKSKCGWSPYEGREFPGRARWVISSGEILMDDFELIA